MARVSEGGQPGFMLYFSDLLAVRKHLDAERMGKLFDAIIGYAESESVPDFSDDPLLSFAFDSLRPALDRDAEEYQKKRDTNRANANRRWEQKKADATACDRM